jgi:hypothetical protein
MTVSLNAVPEIRIDMSRLRKRGCCLTIKRPGSLHQLPSLVRVETVFASLLTHMATDRHL